MTKNELEIAAILTTLSLIAEMLDGMADSEFVDDESAFYLNDIDTKINSIGKKVGAHIRGSGNVQ